MKDIVFKKIVIDFENGKFKDGIVLYQIRNNGKIDNRKVYNSLSIKNMGFSQVQLNEILAKIKNVTKTTEGVKDVVTG